MFSFNKNNISQSVSLRVGPGQYFRTSDTISTEKRVTVLTESQHDFTNSFF